MVSAKAKLLNVDSSVEPSIKRIRRVLPKNVDLKNVSSVKQDEQKKSVVTSNVPTSQTPSKDEPEQVVATPFAKKINAANVSKNTETPKASSVASSRKQLSLGDIRKKLAGSSRLAELKATAERLSKGIQEIKEASEKRNLKEFKSIDVEVPSSPSKKAAVQKDLLSPTKETLTPLKRPLISPRKVVVSPVKSPSKIPAYIRHASLAAPSSSLPLPHQYRFLAELFRGMETVVAMLYNRNEKVTFNKLKPSVQEMLKRNFTEKHLAQIKHLVPDFYNFEIQKTKTFANTAQKDSFEMIISPNFPNDIKVMNPSVLLERRRYFYDTLLKLVKKHHAQFLLTLDPPMEIPDDKLTRWHPEFEIEKVPEVDCAKLPEMPNNEKLSTAQDVLSKARELFKCNTKMERALEKLAQAKARGLTEEEKAATGVNDSKPMSSTTGTQTQPATSQVTLLNPALRNLPASLLEKVKAKQAAKALEAMTRSSQNEEKYMIYSRLPDLARTLRNIFVTERKNVLALNIILSKLDSSFKSKVAQSELQRDIRALAEEAPEWIKLHEIRNTTYLKLDKNADLKKITAKLEALADKYKCD
ncbi:DNA replication factor CDT1 like domain-containing protein [Phthorimaea operculella]|nr:DNA replication factor CDT1 like domain-containing protein [Phthorimaea operculella]